MGVASKNFGFLAAYDPQLERLGALAERFFSEDPNTCLIKPRQFAELLAGHAAAHTNQLTSACDPEPKLEPLVDRI